MVGCPCDFHCRAIANGCRTALLLIPQMGRRKYTMRGQPHGRNMIIREYLWLAYCLSLPPGQKPDKELKRKRKQLSSHIQVLKNFFRHHRCCKW